jgi:proliferating cell nuclear antigen
MHFKTIQASAIKCIFEVLKDILNDVNMVFDTDGLRILALDSARVALVNVFLDAHNFEEYSCTRRVTAGVNISNTYKILKSISGSDIMIMDLTDNESIRVIVHNDTKKMTTTHELKLLDINDEGLDVPDITLDNVTIVPSAEFQKICRDMGQLSQYVTIRRRGCDFEMKCDGDFANQQTMITVTDSESDIENVFSLKYINMFTKATNMSHSLEIFQGQDMPIIFRYCIANLGDMKFYLAPNVE